MTILIGAVRAGRCVAPKTKQQNNKHDMSTKKAPAKKAAAAPAAPAKAKDLKPKKDAKGGSLGWNHNETLVGDTSR